MREPKLVIVVGMKGIGKTFTTYGMLKRYVLGNPAKGIPARKGLIIDVNDEFTEVKAIALNNVSAFVGQHRIELVRIRCFHDDGTPFSLDEVAMALAYVMANYTNGLLYVEDLTKYMGDSLKKDLVGLICTNRHLSLDIIISFQSIQKYTHPKIIANANILRIHKTTDTLENYKKKLDDKYPAIKIAKMIIDKDYERGFLSKGKEKNLRGHWDAKKNFYYSSFVYVELDNGRISGDFSLEEFYAALCDYVAENEKDTIAPLKKRRDERGNFVHTYETARAAALKSLFIQHYGN